jgi:PAS domain S-box-containing protein
VLTLYSEIQYDFKKEQKFALTVGKIVAFGVFHHNAEEALRESEEHFRAAFDFTPIGKVLVSVSDGHFERVNKKFCEMLGYSPHELSRMTYEDITHPDDIEKSHEIGRRVLSGDLSEYTFEKRYIRKDDKVIWASISIAPIRDQTGQIKSFITAIQDITDRKSIEEERQKSLRNYQELVDSIDGIVWEITPDFQFTFVSKQAERILGYPIEQWKSEHDFWANHIHPDDRERAVAFCKAQCSSLLDHDFDYRMIAADGHVVHLRDLVHVVIENGQFAGLKGIMVDITSQKKTAEELQNSYSLLYTTLESTADGILVVDLTGNVTWVNHKFTELWRLPAVSLHQQVDAKAIKSVIKQLKAPDRFLSKIRKLMTNPEAASNDLIEFKDGRVFEGYSQPQRLSNKIVGRVWSFRDVTRQTQAAAQLKDLSDRLSKLMASVSDFLWSAVVDSHGKKTYIFCSAAAEEITGRSPEYFLSDPTRWADIVYSDDKFRVNQFFSDLAVKGHHHQGELDYRIVCPTGVVRWVRDSVTTTKLKSGETRLDGIVCDITERKIYTESRERLLSQETQARKEAERAIQLRDDFLSIATHELRTPLTPIRMNLRLIEHHIETLAPDLPKVDFLRRAVHGTEREFERFLKLVENLLDVSRIRAGRLVLKRREINLSDLVKIAVGHLSAEFKQSQCSVILNSQEQLTGKWDPDRIEQVVVNLVSNAIKYGAGKPIVITTSKTDTHALLQVKDQGIGISKADQGRIFHRFERLAPIKHFGGFGLGLFIAQEIAEAHGGTIRVESEPNQGATFTLELPLKIP